MFRWKTGWIAIMCLVLLYSFVPQAALAADRTTKYRVYQNENILMEFSDYKKAVDFAAAYTYSHVEEIGTRSWLWDNLPRYRVYQLGTSLANWEFTTKEAAIAEARKWSRSSVRDLQTGGWIWNNYPSGGYRLYQGEATLPAWEFPTLEAAKKEAAKWSGAHVIDLSNNRWVWDNLTAEKKEQLRSGSAVYQVYQGQYTKDEWKFAYLEDAVNEAVKWSDSVVVNTVNGSTVYANAAPYWVYQNGNLLRKFISVKEAVDYASKWGHAKIVYQQKEIWNNYPYYTVRQADKAIGEFSTVKDALGYAMKFANSEIYTYDMKKLWDNLRKLQYWGWNGTQTAGNVMAQTSQTMGMEVDSPSWFELADVNGGLKDSSNAELAATLKASGFSLHPLVNNQFDSKLTQSFLSNKEAQKRFIETLVNRCAVLGVAGINVDFESLYGSDRDAYTAFLSDLTVYAHSKKLTVSVDLPRGDVSWNDKTAYDHAKLAQIVDYIVIMTYDQYYSGSTSPGSVSGLDWTENGIKQFLAYGIPRDKLIMGVPFYVREWQLDASGKLVGNRALLMKNLPGLIKDKNAVSTWDEKFGQYKVVYKDGDSTFVFWLEDEVSVKARIAIAKKYDLAGISAWRLGYESAELWKSIITEK